MAAAISPEHIKRGDAQGLEGVWRAVLQIDVEDALEQLRPADAVRPGRDRVDVAVASGLGTSAASRSMNSSVLITRGVVPSRHGVLNSNSSSPAALSCTRSSDSVGRVV